MVIAVSKVSKTKTVAYGLGYIFSTPIQKTWGKENGYKRSSPRYHGMWAVVRKGWEKVRMRQSV